MGCNCKKKIDNFIERYADDKITKEKETLFVKCVNFIIEMVILIVAGLVFVGLLPLLIPYIAVSQITKKGVTFNLTKLIRGVHNTSKKVNGEQ